MAFTHYLPVTVNAGQVPSSQPNFPLLVSLLDARLKTVANGGHVADANGYDLRPYAAVGGAALPFELDVYDGATGTLVLWVKVPTLADGTTVYLYYGDAALTTDGSSTDTWDAGFGAVWHLALAAAFPLNSTAASEKFLINAGASPAAPGQIAGGINTTDPGAPGNPDPFGKHLRVNDPAFFDFTYQSFTLSCWFKPTSLTLPPYGTGCLVFKGKYQENGYYATVGSGGDLAFHTNQSGTIQSSGTDFGAVAAGVFVHLAFVRSGSSVRIFVNGADVTTFASTHVDPASSNHYFDWAIYGNGNIDLAAPGVYDELRVALTNRSADWILTDYRSQASPSTFLTAGVEAGLGDAAFAVRVTQAPVELLALPLLPASRVTQAVIELLAIPPSPGRITQALLELLQPVAAPTATRLTQALVEALSAPVLPAAAVTQAGIEILAGTVSATAEGRVTQAVIELLQATPPPTASRLTQALIEILQTSPPPTAARVTQAVLELLLAGPTGGGPTAARVTQALIEILHTAPTGPPPPPCTAGDFPIDDPGSGGSCPAGLLP